MNTIAIKTLKPDCKGRISEIPAQELWLHKNKAGMASVKKGLKQSALKKTKSLGEFSKHLKD